MKEIPRPLVRANQAAILGGVVLALSLQQPLVIAGLFVVLLAGFLGGPRLNLIFLVARPLLGRRLVGTVTEDAAVQRFNQMLALIMLGAASTTFLAGLPALGWVLSAAVAAAAGLGLVGFCVGCHLYPMVRVLWYRFHRLT